MSCAGSEAPLCTHVRGRRRVASRLRASPPSFRPEAKHVLKGCRTYQHAGTLPCELCSRQHRPAQWRPADVVQHGCDSDEGRGSPPGPPQLLLHDGFRQLLRSCYDQRRRLVEKFGKRKPNGTTQEAFDCFVRFRASTKAPVGGVWPAVSRWRLVLLRLEPTTSFTWVDRFACAPELA